MKVLEHMPVLAPPGRQADTDYGKFLDGRVWRIDEDDVPMPLYRLRATLVSKARRQGLRLTTRLAEQQLFVQAL